MPKLLTIAALYDWDNTIFDRMVLPPIEICGVYYDRETVIENILRTCGMFESLFQSPSELKIAVNGWCKMNMKRWGDMCKLLTVDYNPIHNFDRNEEYTDTENSEDKNDYTGSGTSTTNDSYNNTRSVAAYNNNELVKKDGENGSGESNNTVTNRHNGTRNIDKTVKHTSHLFGNIGVTTTQEMILAEIDLRKNTFFTTFIQEFKENFCIMVY